MADVQIRCCNENYNDDWVILNGSASIGEYDIVGELHDISMGLDYLSESLENQDSYGLSRLTALLASNVRGVTTKLEEVEWQKEKARIEARAKQKMPGMPYTHEEFDRFLSSYCKHPESWRQFALVFEEDGEAKERVLRSISEASASLESE